MVTSRQVEILFYRGIDRKISRQSQRVSEDKLREKIRVVVAGKGVQADSLLQNLQSKPVGRERTFQQTFIIDHVEQFLVLNF